MAVIPFAGTGTPGWNGDGELAIDGDLNGPTRAMSNGTHVFIADTGNRRIRVIDERGILSTYAGSGEVTALTGPLSGQIEIDSSWESSNHTLTQALTNIGGIVATPDGALCFADPGAHAVRCASRWNSTTRWITTVTSMMEEFELSPSHSVFKRAFVTRISKTDWVRVRQGRRPRWWSTRRD